MIRFDYLSIKVAAWLGLMATIALVFGISTLREAHSLVRLGEGCVMTITGAGFWLLVIAYGYLVVKRRKNPEKGAHER